MLRAGKMNQQVKCLLCKADHLSSIPRTHVKMGGENRLLKSVLRPLHACQYTTHIIKSFEWGGGFKISNRKKFNHNV